MTVVVLEGASGVGKTTLAKEMSHLLGWPIYRPFRQANLNRRATAYGELLFNDWLAINSWQEDIHAADLLSVIKTNVILDRSLPSALAYEINKKPPRMGDGTIEMMLDFWCNRMWEARAMVMLLEADPETRQARGGREGDWEDKALRDIFDRMHPDWPARVVLSAAPSFEHVSSVAMAAITIHAEKWHHGNG